MPENYQYYTTSAGKIEKRWAQRATAEERKSYQEMMERKGLIKVTFQSSDKRDCQTYVKKQRG